MSEETPAGDPPKEDAPKSETPAATGGEGIVLELHGRTDVGLVREHNEDSFLVVRLDDNSRDPEQLKKHSLGAKGTLCVVCDGMGGAAAGEVASNMAVESIAGTMLGDVILPPPDGMTDDEPTSLARKLRGAAKDANGQIFREARSNLSRSGMGTTMTAVFFHDNHALIAQVGDSRAYVWRAGHFAQVTRDQSLVNQLLETGHITPEQAKFFEHSNVILQALGVQEEVEVQLSKVELRKGDRFMLCSDGLVGVVTDEEIGAVMGACDDPAETARILIEMANGAGGPDNISVIVSYVAGGAPAPTDADRVEYKLWKIDPEIPLVAPDDSAQAATTAEEPPTRTNLIARRGPQPGNPTAELISMAVIVGLVLGSLLTGMVIYKNGVVCRVEARKEGLSVLADGRDTGIRTRAPQEDGASGAVNVRLRPGHHVLTLRGQGAPEATRELDVRKGEMCEASFTVESADLTGAPQPVPGSQAVPSVPVDLTGAKPAVPPPEPVR